MLRGSGLRLLLSIVVCALLMSARANATTLTTTLAGTGFDASGNVVAGGAIDGNWTINGSGHGPAAYVLGPTQQNYYSGWQANDNSNGFIGSAWIGDTTTNPTGAVPYTFSMTFSLAAFNTADAITINANWWIDDTGSIAINGNTVASGSGIEGSAITINNWSLLNQGLNTVAITMTANDNVDDGVRFQGYVTGTALPEPTVWSVLGGASLLLALAGETRKQRTV